MKLAIEMSTQQKSVALLTDAGDLFSENWNEDRRQPDQLHGKLDEIREKANTSWSTLSALYSGIGPGQYSGMRAAVSTATGLALPGGIPSFGISSGWAMADAYSRETGVKRIAVIGDARRSSWWCGVLSVDGGSPQIESDWTIYSEEELKEHLSRTNPESVITSEKDRCESLNLTLIQKYPTAEDLLSLTETPFVSKPLPIYLHPAV